MMAVPTTARPAATANGQRRCTAGCCMAGCWRTRPDTSTVRSFTRPDTWTALSFISAALARALAFMSALAASSSTVSPSRSLACSIWSSISGAVISAPFP